MSLQFRDLQIDDRNDVTSFLRQFSTRGCEQSFASMCCWEAAYPVQICRTEGRIVLRLWCDKGRMAYLLPLRDERHRALLPLLEQHAAANGAQAVFQVNDPEDEAVLRALRPDYGAYHVRANSDYIYLREKLATLSGSHLQAKRNFVNQFKARYVFEYAPLTAADTDECLRLLQTWREQKLSHGDATEAYIHELDMEALSIKTAFRNFDRLDLTGGVIRTDGRLVAFSYGTPLGDDTFDVMIEKVDERFHGLFQTINQQFAAHLPAQYRYVNRENDVGINGLRKAKESYHPERMLHKHLYTRMTPLMVQVRDLWLKSFEEDTALDAEQFLLTSFSGDCMEAEYRDGRLIAMLHIVPFGGSAYFYAIATDPAWRHRGIGGGLVRRALDRCRRDGYKEAVLIPDGRMAEEWYRNMGFSGSHPVVFNTSDALGEFAPCHGYDYGKGDGTPDLAMVCPLAPDAPERRPGEPLVLAAQGTQAR